MRLRGISRTALRRIAQSQVDLTQLAFEAWNLWQGSGESPYWAAAVIAQENDIETHPLWYAMKDVRKEYEAVEESLHEEYAKPYTYDPDYGERNG